MIEILEGLYLGNRESACDLTRLREAGITHVVNCADELPNYHDEHFVYLALRLRDPDPNLCRHLPRVCGFIDQARKQGRVLVHCFAAVSRSPTVVLAYLCHLGHSLEEAAGRLGQAAWTDPDLLFLRQLAEHHGEQCPDLERLSSLLQGRPGGPAEEGECA
jgi:protein-tyrosine phosphatase